MSDIESSAIEYLHRQGQTNQQYQRFSLESLQNAFGSDELFLLGVGKVRP